MKKTTIYQNEINITDFKTGEVTSKIEVKRSKFKNEPSYVRLYTEGILMLTQITKNEMKTLCQILKYANYENFVELTTAKRKKIVKELNTTTSNFNKNLSCIAKSTLLIKVDTGEYMLNPLVFGRGEWANISKQREEMKLSS